MTTETEIHLPDWGSLKPVSVPAGTCAADIAWHLAPAGGLVQVGEDGMALTEWAVAPWCTCATTGRPGSATGRLGFRDRGDGEWVASCCLRPTRTAYEYPGFTKPEPHAFVRSEEGSGKVCMHDGCAQAPGAAIHCAFDVPEPDPEPGDQFDPVTILKVQQVEEEPEREPEPEPKTPGHTRESTPDGPDFCRECSRHVHEWVSWPCTGELPERCEKHQMAPDQCADCLGQAGAEEMAVSVNAPLPPELPASWAAALSTAPAPPVVEPTLAQAAVAVAEAYQEHVEEVIPESCICDEETLELMGCACGAPAAVSEAPAEVEPSVPVTPAAPAGSVDLPTPALRVPSEAGDEGSSTVQQVQPTDGAPFRKFSNSELRAWKRCRRKWWLTYFRHLTPRREGVGPLSIGNMVHWPLECYYGTPDRNPETFDWETPLAEHVEARLADPELPDHLHVDMLEDYELVKIMLRGYFEWLVEEGADSEIIPLAPEREIEAFIDRIDGTDVWLMGKLDVEAELKSDGRRVFIDHKSVANLTDLPKTGHLDEQQRNYGLLQRLEASALRVAGLPAPDKLATGGVWNMLRKVKRSARAKPPFYGRAGVSHNDETYRNFYLRVWGEARDILATTANLAAGGNHQVEAYPNPTRDCSWDCPFFTICPMFDDGSDVEAVIGMEFIQHDPYARYTEIEKG